MVRGGVPEKRDGNQAAEEHAGRQSHLGLVDAVVLLGEADDGRVGGAGDEDDAHEEAQSDAQVCETGQLGRPVVSLNVHGGNCREEEEEEAKDEAHVQGQKQDDGRLEEKLQGADNALLENVAALERIDILGVRHDVPQFRAIHLLSQPCRLPFQDDRVVGFAIEEDDGSSQNTTSDKHDPGVPSPASTLRDETATDWPQNRSEEDSERVQCHGLASLLGNEEIGYDTSTNCKAGRTANTRQETHDDETRQVGSQSTA